MASSAYPIEHSSVSYAESLALPPLLCIIHRKMAAFYACSVEQQIGKFCTLLLTTRSAIYEADMPAGRSTDVITVTGVILT